eukprot:gene8310-20280_t
MDEGAAAGRRGSDDSRHEWSNPEWAPEGEEDGDGAASAPARSPPRYRRGERPQRPVARQGCMAPARVYGCRVCMAPAG